MFITNSTNVDSVVSQNLFLMLWCYNGFEIFEITLTLQLILITNIVDYFNSNLYLAVLSIYHNWSSFSCTVLGEIPNLRELDLSHNIRLDPDVLLNILKKLPRLWKLNISHCAKITTIEPLIAVKEQLLHLSLAGVMILSTTVTITVLKNLTNLRYLDVSTVATSVDSSHEEVNMLYYLII